MHESLVRIEDSDIICVCVLNHCHILSQCDVRGQGAVQNKTELLEYILIFCLPKYFHKSWSLGAIPVCPWFCKL